MKDRTIAIGDIHGCYHTLMDLLLKVNYQKDKDKLIFVGDYIDRGKYSYEVVNFLINLQKEVGKDNCVCLMGNHENMAYGMDISLWKYNGGSKTIKSYYRNGHHVSEHNYWFSTLPIIHFSNNVVFCHAGLPKIKINENTVDDILWDREWLNMEEPNEVLVVFGHTSSEGNAYYTKNGNICIDTACVYGNKLCAMVINNSVKELSYQFTYCDKSELD